MENRYHHKHRRKYMLKIHLVLVTKYRKKILRRKIAKDVKKKITDLSEEYSFQIVATETDQDHIHILIEYDTTDRVCDLVKTIKQQTTQYVWSKHPMYLSKCYWKKRIFWSDGYFACSIGEVSATTIEKYIASQG